MNYYFKRVKDNVSQIKLYSYTFLIIGLVSIVFYFMVDTPRILTRAKLLMGISFGLCAVFSSIDVFQETKSKQACNVYDLIRVVVSVIMCIISFTCIDKVIG